MGKPSEQLVKSHNSGEMIGDPVCPAPDLREEIAPIPASYTKGKIDDGKLNWIVWTFHVHLWHDPVGEHGKSVKRLIGGSLYIVTRDSSLETFQFLFEFGKFHG